MKKLAAFAFLAIVGVGITAYADQHTLRDVRISVWVPSGWDMERTGGLLTCSDPTGKAALSFITFAPEQLERVTNALDREIARYVQGLRLDGEPREVTVNGMRAVVVDGVGRAEGKALKVSALLVRSPNGRGLLLLGAVESAAFEQHRAVLQRIVRSVRPTR